MTKTTTATIEIRGLRFEAEVTRRPRTDGGYAPREYLSGGPDPDEFGLERPEFSQMCRSRLNKVVGHDQKNCMQCQEDKAWRKYNADEIKIMKEAHAALVEQGALPSAEKVRFSKYAGCSCPCSSGLILENTTPGGYAFSDFFVSLTALDVAAIEAFANGS